MSFPIEQPDVELSRPFYLVANSHVSQAHHMICAECQQYREEADGSFTDC